MPGAALSVPEQVETKRRTLRLHALYISSLISANFPSPPRLYPKPSAARVSEIMQSFIPLLDFVELCLTWVYTIAIIVLQPSVGYVSAERFRLSIIGVGLRGLDARSLDTVSCPATREGKVGLIIGRDQGMGFGAT